MSAPGSAPSRRQKRMGPAPFASFEDLSDELESPEDRNVAGSVVRLPGIREDATPTPGNTPAPVDRPSAEFIYTGINLVGAVCHSPRSTTAMSSSISPPSSSTRLSLQTPSTPRIDISRASSSSHHDSRDSTPERELFEGHDPASAKLGLGFREEGALDLRSSTEELDYQDTTTQSPQQQQQHDKKKGKTRPTSPCLHDESSLHHQRKDSQSSEIGLLSISGRTSRLSSIGSQGSGQSRLSNASHLSVISGQSGLSRSPSPHKMLLETSFCGTKPPESNQTAAGQPGTKVESEVLEKVILSRKIDPTEAVLAEGISVADKKIASDNIKKQPPPEKPIRKIDKPEKRVQSTKSDITIKVDEPEKDISNKIPKRIISKSGVEYIYIPLKGPLPIDDSEPSTSTTKTKVREVKSATIQTKTAKAPPPSKPKPKSATPSPIVHKKDEKEPKYIRIKLKPDYMYSQEDDTAKPALEKPDSLDLSDDIKPIQTLPPKAQEQQPIKPIVATLATTPSASPKLPKHDFLKETMTESKTPSPSLSRKSSFASIFRSKEAIISPESPTVPGCRRKSTISGILREASEKVRDRSRSRSKSRERDRSSNLSAAPSSTESIDSKTKQKSVFSIFKPKKGGGGSEKLRGSDQDSSSNEVLPNIEGIAKVEFKFNDTTNWLKYYENPLGGESIRIPLHSPDHYNDDRSFVHDIKDETQHQLQQHSSSLLQDLKSSSQDSQDTVIEAATRKSVKAVVEAIPKDFDTKEEEPPSQEKQQQEQQQPQPKPEINKRQSSTSSDNVVFSTKLGSNNEIFTTKLPKDKQKLKNGVPEANGDACIIEMIEKRKIKETITGEACVLDTTLQQEIIETDVVKVTRTSSSNSVKDVTKIKTTTSQVIKKDSSNRNSMISSAAEDNDRYSSESERDSEIDFPKSNKKDLDLKLDLDSTEPERKGLVLQQDSYDDELPYIPTTLPLERSAAVPIVPIKQRSTFEMKTCPIERPRSTTPINPSCLEEYCEEVMGAFNSENVTKTIEKLKISLPRHESVEKPVRSPRKPVGNTWFEFAEKGISTGRRSSLTASESDTPPPLPPKGVQKEWINFEEIPERRKPPKKIQTLPSRGHIDVPESVLQDNVVYNYVNPEECKCECHEITAREREKREKAAATASVTTGGATSTTTLPQEDEMPLLDDDDEKTGPDVVDRIRLEIVSDRRSVVSDSSVDLSMSVEPPDANGVDAALTTPFNNDLGVSSNRSSIVSQEDTQSPDSGSPNAFPKNL